jgi:hypothetical protein
VNNPKNIRRIIFVSRQLGPEALLSAQALRRLDNVILFGIGESTSNAKVRDTFSDFVCVDDVHSADQLIDAARRFADKHGSLEQILTAHETLLEPVALANQALGLNGIEIGTVRRVLDKPALKSVLRQARINTPRGAVLTSNYGAKQFVDIVGFPIVLKPLNGSGGLATWCVRDFTQLALALDLMKPSAETAVLAEEYMSGEEVCFDTITIDNQPRLYSICHYRPSIMEALENPRIQWTCVMPRDMSADRYRNLIEDGLKAVCALNVGNAVTHMEGFLIAGGTYTFTDATLRPAGARIGPMLGLAYDMDPHLAWARAVVDGCFDGPWERRYAVGTIFLRGLGCGIVEEVKGIENVTRELASSMVTSQWPQIGATKSATYTGDGYVTVRHSETQTVEDALDFIAKTICITYSEPETLRSPSERVRDQWQERLQHFNKRLNQPAWENDAQPVARKGM